MTILTPPRTNIVGVRARLQGSVATQLLIGALVVAGVISAVSLLFNNSIDYDPEGWIVYGRELAGPWPLNTSGFPAWKPLPAILIALPSLVKHGEWDVYYWLFITRACAVLTAFGAAALAYRFAGRIAAVLAGVFVVLAPYWLLDSTIGEDSAVSGALMTGAFLAHCHGRRRLAVAGLAAIALLRPEAVPLLFLYGVWMWRTKRLAWWFPAGAIALVAFAWLVPTILHTGLSPISISQNSGGPGTAVNSALPALTVIKEAAQQAHQLPAALTAIAIIAAAYSLVRHRHRDAISRLWGRTADEWAMLIAAVVWVLIVAAETEKGFSGNNRYLIPAVVLFLIIGAVVAARIAALARLRTVATAGVLALVAATAVLAVHPLNSAVARIQQREQLVLNMRQELARIDCPRGTGVEANQMNNAWLAQIVYRPLQETVNWHLPYVFFKGGSFWALYCSP